MACKIYIKELQVLRDSLVPGTPMAAPKMAEGVAPVAAFLKITKYIYYNNNAIEELTSCRWTPVYLTEGIPFQNLSPHGYQLFVHCSLPTATSAH